MKRAAARKDKPFAERSESKEARPTIFGLLRSFRREGCIGAATVQSPYLFHMKEQDKQQLIVWWIMWAAFQAGIFMIYHFIGGPRSSVAQPDSSPTWLAGLVPVGVSSIIRWQVLPRVPNAQAALPLFIVGIAMAEATCFLGLFLFPPHQRELFLFSALGIFQFIPFFARRYFGDDENRNG